MNSPPESKRPCLFFDRDGVLNQADIRDGNAYSPRSYDAFDLLPESAGVVQAARDLGYLTIVVTNQPDIARGLMPQAELDCMHQWLRQRVPIDDLYCCPHDDTDNCSCRKPKPGMLQAAADKWAIDLPQSLLIGDSWKDMAAARAVGCRTILLQRPDNRAAEADFRIDSLAQLPHLLLKLQPTDSGDKRR